MLHTKNAVDHPVEVPALIFQVRQGPERIRYLPKTTKKAMAYAGGTQPLVSVILVGHHP